MTFYDYERQGKPKMEPSPVLLTAYEGLEIPSIGRTLIQFKELMKPLEFEIVKTDNRRYPLIGIETYLDSGMVKLDEPVNSPHAQQKITREWLSHNYDDVFKGIGLMPGEYEIKVDKSIMPVQHRPRITPIMMRDDVTKKIRELVEAGVLSRVEEQTEQIS